MIELDFDVVLVAELEPNVVTEECELDNWLLDIDDVLKLVGVLETVLEIKELTLACVLDNCVLEWLLGELLEGLPDEAEVVEWPVDDCVLEWVLEGLLDEVGAVECVLLDDVVKLEWLLLIELLGAVLEWLLDTTLVWLPEGPVVLLLEGAVDWLVEELEDVTEWLPVELLDETIVLLLEELLKELLEGTAEWLLDVRLEDAVDLMLEELLEGTVE